MRRSCLLSIRALHSTGFLDAVALVDGPAHGALAWLLVAREDRGRGLPAAECGEIDKRDVLEVCRELPLADVAFPTSVSRAVVRDFTSGRFMRDLHALVRDGSHTANGAVSVGCAAVAASGWGIVLWFKAPRGRFPGFMNLGQWRHGALVGFFFALLFLAFALRLAREAVDGARMFGLGMPEDQNRP